MTTEEDTPQRRFFAALFRTHLQDWTVEQHLEALGGYRMRCHAEQAHPDRIQHIEDAVMAACAERGTLPALRGAWLYGYRFHDTESSGQDSGAGDGPPAAETREP